MGVLRLLLAAAVYFSHEGVSGLDFMSGRAAVQGFFVISGFYMALVLNGTYADKPLALFYSNRLLRLAPAYFVVLAASVVLLVVWDGALFVSRERFFSALDSGPGTALAIVWTNCLVLGQDVLFLLGFDQAAGGFFLSPFGGGRAWTFSLVPQAWSISLELCFYALAPFLVRRRAGVVAAFLGASLALRTGLLWGWPEADLVVRRMLPLELWFFLSGVLAWRLLPWARRLRSRLPGAAAVAAAAALALGYDAFAPGVFSVVFTLALAAACPLALAAFGNSSLDRYLGELSYPVYLTHFLVLGICEELIMDYSPWLGAALVLGASLALMHLVERPFSRLRRARAAAPAGPGDPAVQARQGAATPAPGALPAPIAP